jgi:hypothetical protein
MQYQSKPLKSYAVFRLSLWLTPLLILGACTPEAGRVTTVLVDAPATLTAGATTSLRATVRGMGTYSLDVSWSVEGGGTFSDPHANPVDYTAPDVSAPAVVKVTATAVSDPGRSRTVEITIQPVGPFQPVVNANVVPGQASVPDVFGNPQFIGAARNWQGVQSDFLVGVLRVRPISQEQLNALLGRYGGTIIDDNSLPPAPPELGITLTDEQRRATEYVVQIDLAAVDESQFAAQATATGQMGLLEFSSLDALKTLAAAEDAVAAGFDVGADYIDYGTQTFPITLLQAQEGADSAGNTIDALAISRFGTLGSQSNVTLAWQFVGAHGIQKAPLVAIVDDGFWLTADGKARTPDTDFLAPPARLAQWDFINNDAFADGPNAGSCGPGNPCFWHGTGSAGVAAGLLNNSGGAAGTGGLVANLLLLKSAGKRDQRNKAIRYAVALGADVVSMSWSYDCSNLDCRRYDRENTPFDDAVNSGSKTVFVASAGNGQGKPAQGVSVNDGGHFYHPCIEDHVICVGALNDDQTTRIGYSNFGDRVDIFAPTDIPVMTEPGSTDNNPAGPASPTSFGGTSASAPFVAGVAALIKAINPNLSGDEVGAILRDTAHPGAGDVTRYIDAYAAVRRAAEGIPAVTDRFEVGPGGNDITPTDLGAAASYSQPNLNLDRGGDRDYFKFQVPGSSVMTIDLQYPEGLGPLSLVNLDTNDQCGLPVLLSDTDLGGKGHRFTYNAPGGTYTFGVSGDDINAYNLLIGFAAPVIDPDAYEPNDTPGTARWLFSLVAGSSGGPLHGSFQIDPRITIDASIHSATDIDYYIVRGPHTTILEQVLLEAVPAVQVYGNESPVTLEVYVWNPDNSQGPLVASVGSGSCTAQALSVQLGADSYYLVRVAGSVGRYTLRNGVVGNPRHIPDLVHDLLYVVTHPGEPVEHVLRDVENYVFVADSAYSQVRSGAQGVHMRLFDFGGDLLSEGDDQLSLAAAVAGQIHVLQISPPAAGSPEQTLSLTWDPVPAGRTSDNFILNPGAEDVDPAEGVITHWFIFADNLAMPAAVDYGSLDGGPTLESPGPDDRGVKFFAGGPENMLSGLRQKVNVDPAWAEAINAGRVKFTFSAFLGGKLAQVDGASASVTFVDANFQTLGRQSLAPVTPQDRNGQTGLFPKETSDDVPAFTFQIYVDLVFQGTQVDYNNGYADNLSLILSDYSP